MWIFHTVDDVIERGSPIVANVQSKFQTPLIGGNANPYAAAISVEDDEKSYNVVSLVKLDGMIFGMFQMSTGPLPYEHSFGSSNHAEDGFISAFEMFTKTTFYDALITVHEKLKKPISITLKQNKTPCETCAPKLVEFAKNYDLNIRIKAMIQYKGNNKSAQAATQLLVQSGIPVIPFNVPDRVSRKNYDTNRWGQPHELKYVKFDEQEIADGYMSGPIAELTRTMQNYKETFSRKEQELAGVVASVIGANGSAHEIADAIAKLYKSGDQRVKSTDTEFIKERLKVAAKVSMQIHGEIKQAETRAAQSGFGKALYL